MSSLIQAETLTGFDVSPDGSTVRLDFGTESGAAGSLQLPAQAVNQLLMNLPHVVEQALRRSQRNDSVRLVHGLDAFRLERGEPAATGVQRYVLTMRTHGGYEVLFAMTSQELGVIVQAVVDQALSDGATLEPVPLNS